MKKDRVTLTLSDKYSDLEKNIFLIILGLSKRTYKLFTIIMAFARRNNQTGGTLYTLDACASEFIKADSFKDVTDLKDVALPCAFVIEKGKGFSDEFSDLFAKIRGCGKSTRAILNIVMAYAVQNNIDVLDIDAMYEHATKASNSPAPVKSAPIVKEKPVPAAKQPEPVNKPVIDDKSSLDEIMTGLKGDTKPKTDNKPADIANTGVKAPTPAPTEDTVDKEDYSKYLALPVNSRRIQYALDHGGKHIPKELLIAPNPADKPTEAEKPQKDDSDEFVEKYKDVWAIMDGSDQKKDSKPATDPTPVPKESDKPVVDLGIKPLRLLTEDTISPVKPTDTPTEPVKTDTPNATPIKPITDEGLINVYQYVKDFKSIINKDKRILDDLNATRRRDYENKCEMNRGGLFRHKEIEISEPEYETFYMTDAEIASVKSPLDMKYLFDKLFEVAHFRNISDKVADLIEKCKDDFEKYPAWAERHLKDYKALYAAINNF